MIANCEMEWDARKAICKAPTHPRKLFDDEIKQCFKTATVIAVRKDELHAHGFINEQEFIQWAIGHGRGVQIQEYKFIIWRKGEELDAYAKTL